MAAVLALLALPFAAALDAARPRPASPWGASAAASVGAAATGDAAAEIEAPTQAADAARADEPAPADPGVGSRPDPALELVRRGAAPYGVDRDPSASGLRRAARFGGG